jgi:ADP-L-glycero-D-manno-heptose 6-epimerase
MINLETKLAFKKQMPLDACIILTGAAGFIGSCLLSYLNAQGYSNIIIVDEFERADKEVNYTTQTFAHKIERSQLFDWLAKENPKVDFVFHLGARTDTTEFDYAVHLKLNVEYSQDMWNWCAAQRVPMVYASSAATYGDGTLGYDDNHQVIEQLQPLNAYGISKNEFDKWAIQQTSAPPYWAGLKFFNVYGPREYHKGRMASVIFHSFNQIKKDGLVKLFRSHKQGYADGEQLRDFVYVKDVVKVCYWLMQHKVGNGLYNLGTGQARSFNALVNATFAGLDLQPNIQYIDMPLDIRDKYQYFTEANMQKLISSGYHEPFYSLEEGVDDYVRNYLSER